MAITVIFKKYRCSTILFSIGTSDGTMTTGQRDSVDTLVEALLPDHPDQGEDKTYTTFSLQRIPTRTSSCDMEAG